MLSCATDNTKELVRFYFMIRLDSIQFDKKISVRDIYNAAKSVPKVYKENVKSLKEGKDMEGGMIRNMTRTMPSKPTKGMPEIMNGVRGPSMSGRGVKGSPEAKEFMRKLREMRKKK
jgi:hypothetical protein